MMTLDELQRIIEDMQKVINPLSASDVIELVSEDVFEKLLTISLYLYDVKEEVDSKLRKLG